MSNLNKCMAKSQSQSYALAGVICCDTSPPVMNTYLCICL